MHTFSAQSIARMNSLKVLKLSNHTQTMSFLPDKAALLATLEVSVPRLMHLSPRSAGHVLRALHFAFPALFILVVLTAPFWAVMSAIAGLFIVAYLFTTYRGCLLSMLEQRLCKDDFTVIDPVLEWTGTPINNRGRRRMTYSFMAIHFILGLWIFWMRWG